MKTYKVCRALKLKMTIKKANEPLSFHEDMVQLASENNLNFIYKQNMQTLTSFIPFISKNSLHIRA
jgi:hypothetical protein